MRRSLLAASVAALLSFGGVAAAQQPTGLPPAGMPSSIDPQMAAQLMARLQASGLTPEQIRARLQAEGYPSGLLDAYLSGTVSADTPMTPEVFAAVRSLGIIDTVDADSLRTRRRRRETTPMPRDTMLERIADSLSVGVDSIDLAMDSLPPEIARRLDLWRATRFRLARQAAQRVDSGYTIFGSTLFDNETSQFDPNLAGPVDPNYRLGPGDELVLILTGEVQAAHELPVTREGFVVIPQVGQVPVANLTLAQLEDVLEARLRRVYSGVGRTPGASTRFSVSVARLRSNQVYVTGDVQAPGSYRVSSAGTAMSALYAAGGPTANGSMRRVEVKRGGQTITVLDVYDYLLGGSTANDPRLQTGDVVFVPSRGPRVRIWGAVLRPATYELAQGEHLDDLIQSAGGFTANADRRRIQIERILPPSERQAAGSDRVVIDVPGGQVADSTAPELPLRAGDVVRIFEIAERVSRQVTVAGNVWTPGRIGFEPGMRLSDALRRAGGVKPDTYLGQVLITRLQPDSTRVQLRAALADTTGAAVDDIVLSDGDLIEIFSKTEFRPDWYVVVSGAVQDGGRIRYRSGMTLRDAVLLAGGLEESALVTEAEIARMPLARQPGMKAVTVRVPIDSSYFAVLRPAGALGGGGPDAPAQRAAEVMLQPYDNVLIFRQPDWTLPQSVVITGEVVRPGRYTLRTKAERLSDLIARAGGVTREAHPGGLVFVRTERQVGRIGIDLAAVLRNPRHRDNLLLVDGDSIAIPLFTAVVNVRGHVNSQVGVPYMPGANLQQYIDAAGGPNATGDPKRAFVTQPSGRIESRRDRGIFPDAIPEPRPGAVIYVPERSPASVSSSFAAFATTATQILGSLIGLVVLINQL